jgi:choline dehydrogenase-like flavoprotein
VDDGVGHIIEGVQHGFGLLAASLPWRTAAEHKQRTRKLGHASWFVGIVQDQGSGHVTIDDAGQAVHTYPLDNELDRQHVRDTVEAMVRLHEAAGADEIVVPAPDVTPWKRGDDLDAFLALVAKAPLGPGGIPLFSAHQMGSAPIGREPAVSVAGPTGELHDTKGVWIGDTAAFPTCSGVNPMVTTEALARRTAGYLAVALKAAAAVTA